VLLLAFIANVELTVLVCMALLSAVLVVEVLMDTRHVIVLCGWNEDGARPIAPLC
jgi:hypothetical protein